MATGKKIVKAAPPVPQAPQVPHSFQAPQGAPWAQPAMPQAEAPMLPMPPMPPMNAPIGIEFSELIRIVTATQAAGFTYAGDEARLRVTEAAGMIAVAWEAPRDAAGQLAVKATDLGISRVVEARAAVISQPFSAQVAVPEDAEEPEEPDVPAPRESAVQKSARLSRAPRDPNAPRQVFGTADGIPMPEAKRFGKPQLYPFDTLSIGGAFFVPNTDDKPDMMKSLASTVNSANKRFADLTPARRFAIRRVTDGRPFGEKYAGISGAGIWRVGLPND